MNDAPGPIRRADAPDTIRVDGAVTTAGDVARVAGPLAAVLDGAGPLGDHATVHSGDGLFQASIPLDTLARASLSVQGRIELDDSPTKCWLVKDVRRIEVTEGRQPDSLPDEERAKT
ncbi:MAG: hypothetical protein AAF548_06250 [Actinomycetota bacterium]